MLLADWPEDLHPASAQGLPSAEDLDRAEALHAAVAGLPGGQRRAVELYYFADLPAGQVTTPPGSALALAAALDVPVRVADALMDRLAVPVTGGDLARPFASRAGRSVLAALRAAEPGLRRRPGRLGHRRQLPR